MGGIYDTSYYTYHYKYNGSSWVKLSNLPYYFYNSSAIVFKDELHILGTIYSTYRKWHFKYNGTSWTNVSTLPYDFYYGGAVVYNKTINILGGNGGLTSHYSIQKQIYTKGGVA